MLLQCYALLCLKVFRSFGSAFALCAIEWGGVKARALALKRRALWVCTWRRRDSSPGHWHAARAFAPCRGGQHHRGRDRRFSEIRNWPKARARQFITELARASFLSDETFPDSGILLRLRAVIAGWPHLERRMKRLPAAS
jgi:hypothetical protein